MARKTARKSSYKRLRKRSTRKQSGGEQSWLKAMRTTGIKTGPTQAQLNADKAKYQKKLHNEYEIESREQKYQIWLKSPEGQKEMERQEKIKAKQEEQQQFQIEFGNARKDVLTKYESARKRQSNFIEQKPDLSIHRFLGRRGSTMFNNIYHNTPKNVTKENVSRANEIWIQTLKELKESTNPVIKEQIPKLEAKLHTQLINLLGGKIFNEYEKMNRYGKSTSNTYNRLKNLRNDEMKRIPTNNPVFMEQLSSLKEVLFKDKLIEYDYSIKQLQKHLEQLKTASQIQIEPLKKQIQDLEQHIDTKKAELSSMIANLQSDPEKKLYLDKLERDINMLESQSRQAGSNKNRSELEKLLSDKRMFFHYLKYELGKTTGGFWPFGPSAEEIAKQKQEQEQQAKQAKNGEISKQLNNMVNLYTGYQGNSVKLADFKKTLQSAEQSHTIPSVEEELRKKTQDRAAFLNNL